MIRLAFFIDNYLQEGHRRCLCASKVHECVALFEVRAQNSNRRSVAKKFFIIRVPVLDIRRAE